MQEWICNECRFDKKRTSDWIIEGPTKVSRHSVISQGHYEKMTKPKEVIEEVMNGNIRHLMDIHSVSEVNKPTIELSKIAGPPHSDDFTPTPKTVAVLGPLSKKSKE